MEDIEKSRVTHVFEMENQLAHIRAEYDRYKALADKWEPVFVVEHNPSTNKVKVGISFGGKRASVTMGADYLSGMDAGGATANIVSSLTEALVKDQLHAVLLPQIEKARAGALTAQSAGKW